MNRYRAIAALLSVAALASCSFEKTAVQDITGPVAESRVRFFNFGVNAPGVNFYAGDNKVTAITSGTCSPTPADTVLRRTCLEAGGESTTGTVYGGVGLGGLYSTLAPGQYAFTGKIAATVDKNLVISTVPGTLAAGKAYSVFLSGFYSTTAKTVEGFIVEDNFDAAIDFTQAYIRFVNGISNSQPMGLIARNTTTTTETPIGAVVAYKGASAFVAIPAGIYDLHTRLAGSSANLVSRTGVSFAAGRVYTIGARGDITLPSSGTATNRAFLDNTANR
jgi:hypothetical protein